MTGGGNLAVTNCLFSGNHAGATGILGGGAIYFDAGDDPGNLSIINSTFITNTAPSAQALGGAIYLSGAGSGNVDTISQCTFTGNSAGSQGGAIYVASGPLTATLNRITGNTAGTANGLYMFATSSGWANATNNWWGANLGPTGAGGDSVYPATSSTPPLGNGQIAFNPWIMLTNTANPGSISGDGTTTLTASFLQNSRQQPLTAGQVAAMVGVPVSWNGALHGSLGSQQTAIQANGQATALFTADGSCNNGSANAAVDHATATAGVTVLCLTASVQPPSAQGAVSILFSNNQSVAFSVVSSTNPATPLTNWTVIGTPTNSGSGLYKFTDVSTTNFVRRFYRIRSP
jgi:predicted outer membrane repeat protein